jgi:ubiquitin C-terminal hydrolase
MNSITLQCNPVCFIFQAILAEIHDDFSGYRQHDSQELLGVALDGLHEDLNRIKTRTTITDATNENGRPEEVCF